MIYTEFHSLPRRTGATTAMLSTAIRLAVRYPEQKVVCYFGNAAMARNAIQAYREYLGNALSIPRNFSTASFLAIDEMNTRGRRVHHIFLDSTANLKDKRRMDLLWMMNIHTENDPVPTTTYQAPSKKKSIWEKIKGYF